MYVKDSMSINPYCVSPDTSVSKALDIMSMNNFHRLPVVDEEGNLLGLVTEGIIAESSPSKATSLSIHEINYLLSKATVESIMIKDVMTISPDALLEEAVLKIRKNQIGCLPVLSNKKVVGIITGNDLFDALVNLLGYKVKGSRYVIKIDEDKTGIIAKISTCFASNNVSIENVSTFRGQRGIEIIVVTSDKNFEVMKTKLIEEGFNVTSAIEI